MITVGGENKFVGAHKLYSVYSLWELVNDIGEKKESGHLNVRILNQFIISFSKLRKGKAALEFHEALKLSAGVRLWCRPSVDEYDKLIQSLCLKALDWEMAEKLQEEMKGSGLHLKGMTRGLIKVVKEMDKEVVKAESIVAGV
ncbi:hypothetical protein JHK82_035238 [Glycine max]|nr:hypothetical protein JHK85_035964 [Glycine max]KAG5111969.1 hypothetical protein JHK82_035238 [Glycine max]